MTYYSTRVDIKDLEGKIVKDIHGLEVASDEVRVFTECGCEYLFYHSQDCCEHVELADFEGDADDLRGALILSAEKVVREMEGDVPEYAESWTWTFYKIETNKGGLWMRWLGESNGSYAEDVYFVLINKPD